MPQEKTNFHLRYYLILLFGLTAIGFSAIFVRSANSTGTITGFYRMGIASAVICLPYLNQIRKKKSYLSRAGFLLAVGAGFFFAGDLALWTTGITISGATMPTIMANTAPIWVGLGSVFLFRERQNWKFWGGLAIAMVGTFLILGQNFNLRSASNLGSMMGLGAAFFYGGYYLLTQRGRVYLDTLSFFGTATISAAVFLFVLNLFLARPFTGYDTPTYLNFLALGVIVQVIGWLAINYIQGYLPASIVAPTLLGQPVVTAVLAFILLGEKLTFWQLGGGIIVLLGVYIVHWSRTQE